MKYIKWTTIYDKNTHSFSKWMYFSPILDIRSYILITRNECKMNVHFYHIFVLYGKYIQIHSIYIYAIFILQIYLGMYLRIYIFPCGYQERKFSWNQSIEVTCLTQKIVWTNDDEIEKILVFVKHTDKDTVYCTIAF